MCVGVAGAGWMGAHHVRVLSTLAPHCRLAAIYDPEPDRARALAATCDARLVGSLDALLDRCEAVVLASPTGLHAEQVHACVRAGRHVLVEKPAAPDLATTIELRDMVRATADPPVVQVGHIEHFNPSVARVRDVLRGDIPLVVSARRLGPPTARVDELDVVTDLMLHDIHVLLSLRPGALTAASGAGLREPGRPTHYAHTTLCFDGGLVAHLTASRIAQQRIRVLEVSTASAHLTADYTERSVELSRWSEERGNGDVERLLVVAEEPLVTELRAFLRSVRDGSPPAVGLGHAVECMQVVAGIRSSLQVVTRALEPDAAASAAAG